MTNNKIYFIFIYVLLSIFIFCNCNQYGYLKSDVEIVNFGMVNNDKPLSASFKLINIGKYTVVIDGIEKDCWCVQIDLKKNLLIPGDSTNLIITMDTLGKGYFDQKILINSRNLEFPKLLLVRGEFLPRIIN